MDTRPDPSEIINNYHKLREPTPKLCSSCHAGEMKKQGVRTSASVNYMVWRCPKCSHEDLEFIGLDKEAKYLITDE